MPMTGRIKRSYKRAFKKELGYVKNRRTGGRFLQPSKFYSWSSQTTTPLGVVKFQFGYFKGSRFSIRVSHTTAVHVTVRFSDGGRLLLESELKYLHSPNGATNNYRRDTDARFKNPLSVPY